MTFKRNAITGALAVVALVSSSLAALAAPAVATGNVNVRTGPGTGYAKIGVLYAGQQVDVQQCQGGWCYVAKSGSNGWVSSNFLAGAAVKPPKPPKPPKPHWGNEYAPPIPGYPYPVYPGYPTYPAYPGNGGGGSICFNGPNGYFCLGSN